MPSNDVSASLCCCLLAWPLGSSPDTNAASVAGLLSLVHITTSWLSTWIFWFCQMHMASIFVAICPTASQLLLFYLHIHTLEVMNIVACCQSCCSSLLMMLPSMLVDHCCSNFPSAVDACCLLLLSPFLSADLPHDAVVPDELVTLPLIMLLLLLMIDCSMFCDCNTVATTTHLHECLHY